MHGINGKCCPKRQKRLHSDYYILNSIVLLTLAKTHSVFSPTILWGWLEKNHSQGDESTTVNRHQPQMGSQHWKETQNYVFLVVCLPFSSHLSDINKIFSILLTSEFYNTYANPLPTLPNHSAGNLRKSDFYFHEETKAIRIPQIPATRTTNKPYLYMKLLFLPHVSEK